MEALKGILNGLGFAGSDDLEGEALVQAVTEHVNANFVKRDKAHLEPEVIKRFEGKSFGEVYGALAKVSEKSRNELSELSGAEAVSLVVAELNQKHDALQAKYDQYKEDGKKGTDKRVLELEQKLADKDQSIQDFTKANEELKATLQQTRQESEQKFTEYVERASYKDAISSVKFADSVNDITKAGFDTTISRNYSFKMEGEGENRVYTARDKEGNLVPSKSKVGEHLTPAEVMQMEAEKHGLLKNSEPPPKEDKGGGRQEEKKFTPRRQPNYS